MPFDPFMIDASGGEPAYGGQEVRLALSTLLHSDATTLGTRSGVRYSGAGTGMLVQAQTTPNMSVRVQPGSAVVQSAVSASQGAYIYVLDAVKTVTITAAHASLTRIDRVCVRVRDAGVDTSGARDGDVVVVQGTAGSGVPGLPTDASYLELGRVTVPANAINIGGSGQGSIADMRTFMAAAGGIIYTSGSANAPDPATLAPGTQVWWGSNTSTARLIYSDGSTYQYVNGRGNAISVASIQDNTAGTTTSASYTDTLTGTSPLSVSFIVPSSGKVMVTVIADIVNASGRAYMSYRFSGATTLAATDAWALMNGGTGTLRASSSYLHTSLPAGPGDQTITVTAQHHAVGGTATFDARRIMVTPVF